MSYQDELPRRAGAAVRPFNIRLATIRLATVRLQPSTCNYRTSSTCAAEIEVALRVVSVQPRRREDTPRDRVAIVGRRAARCNAAQIQSSKIGSMLPAKNAIFNPR